MPRKTNMSRADGVAANIDDPATVLTPAESPAPPRQTKQRLILDLLRRETGASIDELAAATGWLPHTTRAALTGLRKKGITLEKSHKDGATRYTAVAG